MTKTLDNWLAELYTADTKSQLLLPHISKFKDALGTDATLLANAKIKLTSLNAMIETRGETACAYSTKYRNYLREVLGT